MRSKWWSLQDKRLLTILMRKGGGILLKGAKKCQYTFKIISPHFRKKFQNHYIFVFWMEMIKKYDEWFSSKGFIRNLFLVEFSFSYNFVFVGFLYFRILLKKEVKFCIFYVSKGLKKFFCIRLCSINYLENLETW